MGWDSTACAASHPTAGAVPQSSPTPHEVSTAALRTIITPAAAPACIGRPCLTSRSLVLIIVSHIRHLVVLGLCSCLCTARVSRPRQRPGDQGDVRLQALEALPVASLQAPGRDLTTSVCERAYGAHSGACCTAQHVCVNQAKGVECAQPLRSCMQGPPRKTGGGDVQAQ